MKAATWEVFQTKRMDLPSSQVKLIRPDQTKEGIGRQVVCCTSNIEKALKTIKEGKEKWEAEANGNELEHSFNLFKRTAVASDVAEDKLDLLEALQEQYTSIMGGDDDDKRYLKGLEEAVKEYGKRIPDAVAEWDAVTAAYVKMQSTPKLSLIHI